MKKLLVNAANPLLQKKLSRAEMKKITGGQTAKAGWICGCLDVEDNFYPGPSGGGYCWTTYCAEPWCIRG